MLVFSNWTKGNFYNVDFSAAVIKAGKERPEGRVGKPAYIHVNGYQNGISMRNAGPIYGKDEGGNYWMHTPMRLENWEIVQKAFDEEWGST